MQSALFFDWYSASIQAPVGDVADLLQLSYPGHVWEISSPKNGYSHCDKLLNPAGEAVLQIMYGGSAQGSKVHAFSSGSHAHRFAWAVRKAFPIHEVTRVDVAIDYDEQGAWRSLHQHGLAVSRAVSVKNNYQGPSGEQDYEIAAEGRTLYVGSRSSVSMLRIYEKGQKDDKTRPYWVRAEFEFKPKTNREAFCQMSPLEIVNNTKLGRAFFSQLVTLVKSKPVKCGTIRVETDHERSLRHLKNQYKNILLAELKRLDGCYESLGLSLLSDTA